MCIRDSSIGIDADYGSLDAGRWGNVVLVNDKLDIQKAVSYTHLDVYKRQSTTASKKARRSRW